jgi:hypothetical protein
MEKPKLPKRKKAGNRPTAKTPGGKSKSQAVQLKQWDAYYVRETAKDKAFDEAMAAYEKDKKAWDAKQKELAELKGYKVGDNSKAKKKTKK